MFWGVIVNLGTSVLFWVLAASDVPSVLLAPAYLLPLPYNVFVCIAVWRSADRYAGPARHAALARWGTLAGMIALSLT